MEGESGFLILNLCFNFQFRANSYAGHGGMVGMVGMFGMESMEGMVSMAAWWARFACWHNLDGGHGGHHCICEKYIC